MFVGSSARALLLIECFYLMRIPETHPLSLQRFLTFSFTSQRERQARKDERTHHGAMDQTLIGTTDLCKRVDILYCKKGPTLPPLVGLTAGREADEIWVDFEILKLLYRLNYSDLLISLQLYCSIRTAFIWLLSR